MSPMATVEMPAGVRHHCTMAHAESWRAWDALTAADGWDERSWPVEEGGVERVHVQKEATIRTHRIVIFPPHFAREAAAA